MSKTNNYIQYTTVSYSGRKLLERHSLEEEGLWQIKGEDPNCDMGGSHHQPDLGIVYGKLKNVIEYAVELSGFWQWGAGGDIKKIDNIVSVDDNSSKRRKELLAQREILMQKVNEIDSELNDYGGEAYV